MKSSNLTILILCLVFSIPVGSQTYPYKPIRFVTAYPAGGPSDLIARTISKRLYEVMGQPVIVESRSGAGGHMAAENVVRSIPDGYTLFLGGSFLTIGPSLSKNLSYNPEKDFTKIGLVVLNQYVLVTHPMLPVRNVKDLIALAKARPGQLNYATSGVGAPPHLATELFNSMSKISAVHIPYKGASPALTDLISGQVSYYLGGISGLLSHVKSGRLRALAVTGSKRSPELSKIPTIAESALPGYEIVTWFGVIGPAGIPKPIIERLNEVINGIVKEDVTFHYLLSLGLEPTTSTPQELAAIFIREIPKFFAIVKGAGIEAQ